MKAPDKIYVSRNFSEDDSPHGLWHLNKSEHDVNLEYIRKDALLEWMDQNIKELNVLYGEIFIARVKDKLNSM
jgi:hypothetical protein